jgi:hypothetical protein
VSSVVAADVTPVTSTATSAVGEITL